MIARRCKPNRFGPPGAGVYQGVVVDSGHPTNPRLYGRVAMHLLRRRRPDEKDRYTLFLYLGRLRLEVGHR